MTETNEPQYRAYHQPDPDRVSLRETGEGEDGVFTVRMPIASTGEVRNEGDEPLTRDELSGMAEQIDTESVGVFLDHGASALGGAGGMFGNRYSAVGKVGTWEDPDLTDTQEGDGPAFLEADARLMDPETLPAASGDLREALAALKSQVERDIPLSSSIGWREDENSPGGNDLMEASIVGIPADPRTVSESTAAVARAAIDAGADPEEFLSDIRAVVMGPDAENHDMTDETDEPPETVEHEGRTYVLREEGDTTDEESTEERQETPEWASKLLEAQEEQTELLRGIDDAVREDDMDDDEDEEENEGETEDEDEDEDEQSSEPEEEQSSDVEELQDALNTLREGGIDVEDVDVETPDEEQSAEEDETEDEQDEQTERETEANEDSWLEV